VIASTNKNLFSLVKEKKFREDLYYRVNILKIKLIPLREKKEDIPYFINSFIRYYSPMLDKPIITLSSDAMSYASSYDWPGNIRELRNFVERLMVVSKKVHIELDDISGKLLTIFKFESVTELNLKEDEKIAEDIEFAGYDLKSLNNSEEEYTIKLALKENKGIINLAARELGISRTTLWRKMKKHNLDVSK
jgi:transcriptional regulator with PAS, ATPase and Fis domain